AAGDPAGAAARVHAHRPAPDAAGPGLRAAPVARRGVAAVRDGRGHAGARAGRTRGVIASVALTDPGWGGGGAVLAPPGHNVAEVLERPAVFSCPARPGSHLEDNPSSCRRGRRPPSPRTSRPRSRPRGRGGAGPASTRS